MDTGNTAYTDAVARNRITKLEKRILYLEHVIEALKSELSAHSHPHYIPLSERTM